jgi:hypothetical protein
MFDKIMHNQALFNITCHDCSENNATVDFDSTLLINGFLNHEKFLILKPDNYYNAQCIEKRPPSPDCLILINCTEQECYDLYLIELKDVKNTRELKYEIIVEKFKTMINLFFLEFEDIFSSANYKTIAFYLVTTYPKNSGHLSDTEYHRRIANSALDAYGSRKPLKLFNKAILIQPKPSPLTIISSN